MNELIIGMGEVGKAVQAVTDAKLTYDVDDKWPKFDKVDVLHICFPYSERFVADVKDYIKTVNPEHIVVWSTVPIGTCVLIDERAVHSPIEGVHPHLESSIRTMNRWVGYNLGSEGRFFGKYFHNMGLETAVVDNTETTELLKLRSTAKYGINLVWAQYEQDLCKDYGVNYTDLMAYDEDYNKLYQELNMPQFQRYVLFQPDGVIGGHCVVPNAKMLYDQYPSDLLANIIAMEKK